MRAIQAGNDIVLHSPDDAAAFPGIKAAVEKGEIRRRRSTRPSSRILRAKARLGCTGRSSSTWTTSPTHVGSRAHKAVARDVSQRSITLIKDERESACRCACRATAPCCISRCSTIRPAGASRRRAARFIPELRKRWPNVTAIELSDRTTPSEIELVRAMAPRYDAIVASVFVRASSASGRMDLPPPLVRLLQDLARATARTNQPYVTVLFGNPYTATFLPDAAGGAADLRFLRSGGGVGGARAGGRSADHGPAADRALPGIFEAGHGLTR